MKKYSSKNGLKGKNIFQFVRYGGLNLISQKGYTNKNPTYHSPPSTRGIYAFPKIAQERFLIGSIENYQPVTMPKEPKWNELSNEEYDIAYHEYAKKRKIAYQKIKREFTKTDGYIWHHLVDNCKPSEIIDRHGSWIKTNMSSWAKAFAKESLQDRYGNFNAPGEESLKISSINSARGIAGLHTKDHYEVFFDEKV
jgi:hypothetical protein